MIDLIHIAGAGRSGSTLLEMVLANHPDAIGLGATRMVWQLGIIDNVLIPSGERFRDNAVWRPLVERFSIDDAAHMHRLLARTTGTRQLPESLVRHRLGKGDDARRLVSARTSDMLSIVATSSGRRILVDSTSSAGYTMILAGLDDVRVSIIHLVRDPRAVSYSWANSKPKPEFASGRSMRVRSSLSSDANWLATNGMVKLVKPRKGARYVRMSYEQFCRSPKATLDQALEKIGFPGFVERIDFDAIRTEQTIGVAGNPNRFSDAPITIRLDDRYRSATQTMAERLRGALLRQLV